MSESIPTKKKKTINLISNKKVAFKKKLNYNFTNTTIWFFIKGRIHPKSGGPRMPMSPIILG